LGYKARGGSGYNGRSRRSVYSVHAGRSARSKALDNAFKAPLAKSDEQWMNAPNRFDWPNIDTPKPKPSVESKVVQEVKLEPKIEQKLEPQVVETKKTAVLIQPEIVKTASIPEAIVSHPSKAKTYAEGGQSFEVLEDDYIKRRFEREQARVRANINYYGEQKKEVNNDSSLRDYVKKRKLENLDFSIKAQNIWLENMLKPKNMASNEHYYRKEYIDLIKDSIKHGKPVPEEVVLQRPEFRVAQDARRRYEKGLHTSFANKSAAVNAVMFLEKGYKVKRQDGKEIKDYQINEIGQGVEDIQKVTGPIKDVMSKADLTIAHTSGKYPFLMVAGGLYHPNEKTITMGISGIKSLAHEWAHWLDYEGGKENKYGYETYYGNRKTKKVASSKSALSNAEGYSPLFTNAIYNMNNPSELRDLYKKAYGKSEKVTPEEKQDARDVVARVGGYWRDPREIWARLVEQYVAVSHGKKTQAAESPEYYYKHPAYWSPSKMAEYAPQIKAEIERRISNARGGS